MNNVHCTLYTVHCTLYSLNCTVYTPHCTPITVHCILLITQYRVQSSPTDQYVVFAHWMLCCPVGFVERGGALPPVTGLTVQRIICCQASYWPCNPKLSSYWSGSLSLRIIVLSQFPTPVPVQLNDGKIYHPQKPGYHF